MPVRLRITLLFVALVIIILGLVCGGIYYFSYTARLETIKTRLTNRAMTTAKLLAQQETFDKTEVQRIDSLTTISLKNKTVLAYDYRNRKIYNYSDVEGDTMSPDPRVLAIARKNGSYFFNIKNKEAVAYYYAERPPSMVVISMAEDAEAKENLANLKNILVFSFLIGVAFILVTGYFFSGRLLYPIKKITEDVREISAQNLTRRLKTGAAKDEWHKLSNTLNDLLNRLQESFELQRRFISNASHELSTPLTSISSQIEVSLQREREAGEYRQVMQSIYQDVTHMGKLTQTLLEFAKASGNTGGLEINVVRIDEVLMRLPSEVAKNNGSYTVTLEFKDLPEDEKSLLVFGNETLLFTAFKNIVVNACKYSPDHKADVELSVTDKSTIISISDAGRGIPEDEMYKVFQPFYRIGDESKSEGFGLGLALAERIIKLHKGTIEIKSQVNRGTKFTITLAAARALAQSF